MFESSDKTFNGLAGLRGSGGFVPGMGRVEPWSSSATADSETRMASRDTAFVGNEYCFLLMKSCETGDFSYAQAIPREMLSEDLEETKIYDGFWSRIKKYGPMSPERFRSLVKPSALSDYDSSYSLQEMADLAYANISVKYWSRFFRQWRDKMYNALAIPNDFLLIIKNATQMYWSLWNRVAGLPSLEDEDYKTSLDCDWGGVNGEVPWGFNSFDNDLGGIRPGEVALLAGEAGTGKTFILCKKAADWVQQGYRVGIVSVEMSDTVIQQRVEACMAHFDPHIFRRRMAPKDLEDIKKRLKEVQARAKANGGNIFYFPKGEKSLESVAQRAKDSKLDVLIIDGLYLMRSDDQPKKTAMWEQMKSVSDGVSHIAQELGLPILASTQFNRQAREMDFDINSIGYSHAFAQDADAVISLERDNVAPEVRFLQVRKNRNGSVGARIQLNIDWKRMHFGVMDRSSIDSSFSSEKPAEESWEAVLPKKKETPESLMTPTVLMHTPNGKPIAKNPLSDQPLTNEEIAVLKMAKTSLSETKSNALPSWDGVEMEKDSGIRSVYKQGDISLLDALSKEVHPSPSGPYIVYPGMTKEPMLLLSARAESLVKKESAKRAKKLKSKGKATSTHHKNGSPILLAATCADGIKLLPEPKKKSSAPQKWWKVKLEEKIDVPNFSTEYPEEVKIHVATMNEYWDALNAMRDKKVTRSTWLKWHRSIFVCDEAKQAAYIQRDRFGIGYIPMTYSRETYDEMFRLDDENYKKNGDLAAENRRYTVYDKKKVAKYGGLDEGGVKVRRVERTDR